MTYCNLLAFFLMIYTNQFIKHVLSLSKEGIRDGRVAVHRNFRYQAAIIGRKYQDSDPELLGSGVIISRKWILCSAQSFMQDSQQVEKLIFTAVVGYASLNNRNTQNEVIIVATYTYLYHADSYTNDIAMARTIQALGLYLDLVLDSVAIPNSYEIYLNKTGIVSGYGDSKVIFQTDLFTKSTFMETTSDFDLRYMIVEVKPASQCGGDFPPVSIKENQQFCGVANRLYGLVNGACLNDIGSPLVIEGSLAGLVSVTHGDCNDVEHGALYTNVSAFYEFIHNTMNAIQMDGVKVYRF